MDKIEMMQAFIAVAQEGSFTTAANRLGVSTKLVSKYVQRLEASLETQLFNRTTRSVTLTDVGSAYLENCRQILEQLDELESEVRERQGALAGLIRITAPTGFGSTHLVDALAPFLAAHPKVEVELKLSDARVALVEEGFDLAVRIGVLRDSTFKVRKLAEMPLVVCAAPAYLEAHGRPQHPNELATHNCLIDEYTSDATSWRFKAGAEEIVVRIHGTVRANSPGAISRLAIGGLGVARCPLYAVAQALDDLRLERLLREFPTDVFSLQALYPLNRHLTARVRALIDHFANWF